jgi:hypothetical protein
MDKETPTYLVCDPCPPNLEGYKIGTITTFLITEPLGPFANEFLLTEAATDTYSLEQITTK